MTRIAARQRYCRGAIPFSLHSRQSIIQNMNAAFPFRAQPVASITGVAVAAWLLVVSMFAIIPVDGRINPFQRPEAPPTMRVPVPATTPKSTAFHTRPASFTRSAEDRLATSIDLLDFVESIRRNPVHGGHYLALKAYDFCTRESRQTLDALVDGTANGSDGASTTIDGAQRDAQARLSRLCGTFRHRNLAEFDYYLLAEEGLQMQDARLIAARRIDRLGAHWDTTSHEDASARQALIAEILNGGDGWLIRDLADEFEAILHTGQLVIGGVTVSTADTADAIDALRMMACEHGADCTRDGEWRRLLACASAGECRAAFEVASVNALRWRNNIRVALLKGIDGIDVVPLMERRY